MARVCTILILTRVSEDAENRQIMRRIDIKMRPNAKGVKTGSAVRAVTYPLSTFQASGGRAHTLRIIRI